MDIIYNKYKNCTKCELGFKYKDKFIGISYGTNISTLLISDYLTYKESELINQTLNYYKIDNSNVFITTPVACHTLQDGIYPNIALKTCRKVNDLLYTIKGIRNVILLGNMSKSLWFGFKEIKDGLYKDNNILYLICENITQIGKFDDTKKEQYDKFWRYYSIYQQY